MDGWSHGVILSQGDWSPERPHDDERHGLGLKRERVTPRDGRRRTHHSSSTTRTSTKKVFFADPLLEDVRAVAEPGVCAAGVKERTTRSPSQNVPPATRRARENV